MSLDAPPRRRRSTGLVLALLLIALVGAGIGYWQWPATTMTARVAATNKPVSIPPPTTAPAVTRDAAPTGPSFDVVRVGPQGRAVIAGRAESGTDVTVRDGADILGQARADATGQFVLLPDAPLPSGGRELTLSARRADGTEVAGRDTVLLVVPPHPVPAPAVQPGTPPAVAQLPAPAVAVLLPHGAAPPRLLNGAATGRLGLDVVDYDEAGDIRFAGSAKPDTPIRLYVDNQPVGDARADAGGQWAMRPTVPVPPGLHQLRVDQLGPQGRVVARVELPFQRTAVAADAPSSGRAVVQPGQNLWRIARQSYGQGTRFTVIFLANRDQIRDPNRIYPGQVFTVPPRS